MKLREHPNSAPIETFTASDLDAYGPHRYHLVEFLADQFWKRWSSEHMHQLTTSQKWQFPTRSFCKGDVVLVRNPLAPRNYWETGVITEIISSTDKHIRNVKVLLPPRTKNVSHTIATKGIHDLVLLTSSVDLALYRSGVHPSLCGESLVQH